MSQDGPPLRETVKVSPTPKQQWPPVADDGAERRSEDAASPASGPGSGSSSPDGSGPDTPVDGSDCSGPDGSGSDGSGFDCSGPNSSGPGSPVDDSGPDGSGPDCSAADVAGPCNSAGGPRLESAGPNNPSDGSGHDPCPVAGHDGAECSTRSCTNGLQRPCKLPRTTYGSHGTEGRGSCDRSSNKKTGFMAVCPWKTWRTCCRGRATTVSASSPPLAATAPWCASWNERERGFQPCISVRWNDVLHHFPVWANVKNEPQTFYIASDIACFSIVELARCPPPLSSSICSWYMLRSKTVGKAADAPILMNPVGIQRWELRPEDIILKEKLGETPLEGKLRLQARGTSPSSTRASSGRRASDPPWTSPAKW